MKRPRPSLVFAADRRTERNRIQEASQMSAEIREIQLLSTAEVAKILRLSPHTVRALAAEGRLRVLRFRSDRGALMRFDPRDVQRLIEGEPAP
jgi:excisionase family DNA binding protein